VFLQLIRCSKWSFRQAWSSTSSATKWVLWPTCQVNNVASFIFKIPAKTFCASFNTSLVLKEMKISFIGLKIWSTGTPLNQNVLKRHFDEEITSQPYLPNFKTWFMPAKHLNFKKIKPSGASRVTMTQLRSPKHVIFTRHGWDQPCHLGTTWLISRARIFGFSLEIYFWNLKI